MGSRSRKGVYCFSSEAQLTGKLVLDAQGDPSAVFVFQVGSTLTTGSNASVVFINGGQDCRAFWQIGSSATLGTDTVFAGSILALTSITLNTRRKRVRESPGAKRCGDDGYQPRLRRSLPPRATTPE